MLRRLPSSRAALLSGLVVACSGESTTPDVTEPPAATDAADAGDAPVDAGPASPPTAFTAEEVQDLFSITCVRCHAPNDALLDLSSFAESTIGVPPGTGRDAECATSKYRVRIAAGDREASLLWHKVNGTQDCGDRMPPTGKGAKLDAATLERLGLFIDALEP